MPKRTSLYRRNRRSSAKASRPNLQKESKLPRWCRSNQRIRWLIESHSKYEDSVKFWVMASTKGHDPILAQQRTRKMVRKICDELGYKPKLPYGLTRESLNRRGQF